MNNLLKERAKSVKKPSKKKNPVIYSASGKAIRQKLSKGKRVVLGIGTVVASILLLIYIPPIFYQDQNSNTYVPIMPNAAAIKSYQTYLRDNPDADFDMDGLSNAIEEEYGTDVWKKDSDGDGISDYAEIYLTETSPIESSAVLIDQMMKDDEKHGYTLGTPYKIDDIIFWPDTYTAKSYGAVVRTVSGFRFCNYNGWVRFPKKVYAYGYNGDYHYDLPHRENEDAWKIETADEILLYDTSLTFVHCLKLPLMDTIYLQDTGLGKLLSNILPEHGGLITCYKAASIDINKKEEETVTAKLKSPLINKEDFSRLGSNRNTLRDLSWVMGQIEAGNCVAVSMYSGTVGEAIGIVYGYTQRGDLLVADEQLNPVGTIHIKQNAKRMMNKEGTIGQISWFDWEGLGFDSVRYGDRINFFASTMTAGQTQDSENVPETEPLTEHSTEKMSEVESEAQSNTVVNLKPETEQIPKQMVESNEPETAITESIAPDLDTSEPPVTDTLTTEPISPEVTETLASETEGTTEETEKIDQVITFGF